MYYDFSELHDRLATMAKAELQEVYSEWKDIPDEDKTLMFRIAERFARCAASEALGIQYSRLELDAATAALANCKVGVQEKAAKSLLAVAKRVAVWLGEVAYDIGSQWVKEWGNKL